MSRSGSGNTIGPSQWDRSHPGDLRFGGGSDHRRPPNDPTRRAVQARGPDTVRARGYVRTGGLLRNT